MARFHGPFTPLTKRALPNAYDALNAQTMAAREYHYGMYSCLQAAMAHPAVLHTLLYPVDLYCPHC